MKTNTNVIYFILLSYIKYSFCQITNNNENSKYNYLVEQYFGQGSEINCDHHRDDGFCIQSTNCPDDARKINKNYFGIFFNVEQCSNNAIIDFQSFTNINTGCENENALKCQYFLNKCTFLFRNKQEISENGINYCQQIRENINDRFFLSNSYLQNTKFLSGIKYSLKTQTIGYANHNLNFKVAKYYYNGTLLKFEDLGNDFLQCSNSNNEKTDYKFFGNNIEKTCYIDITKYLHISKNFFYEIYLEAFLEETSNNREIVEIPIRILNENELDKNKKDEDNIQLVKRMFLHYFDTNNENRYYYAKRVKLCVRTIKGTKEENIYLPIFEVTYAEKDNYSNEPFIKYTFISEYKSDISEFMRAMKIVFIILTCIVGLVVFYRTYVWFKMNPSELVERNYILLLFLEFFYKSCKYLGIFYFWFTFGISAYWYIIYKLQFRVYYFMPPLDDEDGDYKLFKIIFFIGFFCHILYMFIRIYKQVTFDIFFIDWETEKNMAMNDVKSSLDQPVQYKKYRSAWRMIHVVNQFNELQKKRVFNLYFAFSWIILLYHRCGWYRREHQVPRDANVDGAPVNFVLRNFIAGIIIMASASIELVLVRLLQIWLPLKKQEFMDLCSVSNISVFILDELLHGYYIHGLSPIGKADVNYDELFQFLRNEGGGSMRNRGLENDGNQDHSQNQSYEMFISNVMRTIYDGLYIIQTESMLAKGVSSKKYFKRSRLGMRLFRNFLNYEKNETLLDNYMNNQLKSKIDLVSSNIMQYIKDKSFLQRFLGYTIDNNEFMRLNAPDIIFYRDYRQKFDDLLFCGMEWEWFIMDLYIFQMFMITVDDDYLALFLTFIIDYILYYIRVFFGNKNVAKKAVVDERFLN